MQTRTILAALIAAPLLTGLGIAVASGPAPAAAAPAASNAATTYKVDAVHSHVLFRTMHLGVSYAHGRFNTMEGEFSFGDSPSIELKIDTSSVDTQNAKRDSHLKGADFFDAAQFPTARFKSSKIVDKGDGKYDVAGKLELLGKQKQVNFEAQKLGEKTIEGRGQAAGVHASFTIKRSDYGMTWGVENGAVGDEVTIEVSLEGTAE